MCVVDCRSSTMKVGDRIRIVGKTAVLRQTVKSLQVESRDVAMAAKGQLVGLKIKGQARPGDLVFRD